ncbi:MAG: hypothetical protein K6F01_01450 [Selenomonas sp.]|uniref:hypothetical protein n=1 Tax=Selenomonas sp. TaxID=2053611 RepID=UPI0025DDF6ED|nr:hypothetical protein [Selenomonas sp.]MCR5438113.1 hypothetical protein [Selenomonas sp.]
MLKKEITGNITKEKVLQLINKGILPNPKDMDQDYYYCSVDGFGLIVDKMGNVYRFSETSLDFGKFASEQISLVMEIIMKKNNVDDYVNSIAGESAGVNIAVGRQVGILSWNGAPVSTEVGVTTGAGMSVGFRETKRVFNLYY